MREGASKRGESMAMRGRDETATVRVTNLSESTREQDLQELFRQFGDIVRIFLAKDKNTGISKGFAFINFKVSVLLQFANYLNAVTFRDFFPVFLKLWLDSEFLYFI